jgi:hypothetical protein
MTHCNICDPKFKYKDCICSENFSDFNKIHDDFNDCKKYEKFNIIKPWTLSTITACCNFNSKIDVKKYKDCYCKELNVNVGSGFTKDFLEEMRGKEDSYIGRIAKIQYNVKITDKFGNNSLFLPRLVEVRDDKTEGDDFKKIK